VEHDAMIFQLYRINYPDYSHLLDGSRGYTSMNQLLIDVKNNYKEGWRSLVIIAQRQEDTRHE
jgi:hypothetical protein